MTAVFVTNYEMTMGAVIGVNELGIHMPEDLSMIETISNPQQSWGDSWTQGAINVVSN